MAHIYFCFLTAEFKKTLLSRDLKYSLFDLFASWSGKFSHTFSALDKRLVICPDQHIFYPSV